MGMAPSGLRSGDRRRFSKWTSRHEIAGSISEGCRSPADLEKDQGGGHGGVQGFHLGLHRDGEAEAGAGLEGWGEAGAFGSHGEEDGAFEIRMVEILAVPGDEGGPAGMERGEAGFEVVRAGVHGDREAEEAAGGGSEGAGMVGVSAAGREDEAGGAGGFGDAGEGSEVAGVLEAVEVEVGTARAEGQGLGAGAGEGGDGKEAAGGVGVGEAFKDVGAHFQGRNGEPGEEAPAFGGVEEGRSYQDLFKKEAGGQGFFDEVRTFEEEGVTFTSPEPPNKLDPLIVRTGDHRHGS